MLGPSFRGRGGSRRGGRLRRRRIDGRRRGPAAGSGRHIGGGNVRLRLAAVAALLLRGGRRRRLRGRSRGRRRRGCGRGGSGRRRRTKRGRRRSLAWGRHRRKLARRDVRHRLRAHALLPLWVWGRRGGRSLGRLGDRRGRRWPGRVVGLFIRGQDDASPGPRVEHGDDARRRHRAARARGDPTALAQSGSAGVQRIHPMRGRDARFGKNDRTAEVRYHHSPTLAQAIPRALAARRQASARGFSKQQRCQTVIWCTASSCGFWS